MSTGITSNICKNCNQSLQGNYCHQCGEKVVEENDFHFKTLVSESIGGLFNLDSKVFKSFYFLLLKPGKLTSNYIEGIRKPFMKPIQLFLVINVLFFLLLTQADILRIPSKYYFANDKANVLNNVSRQSGITELDLRYKFDTNSANYSKAAVILLIPFFAVVLMVINYKRRLFFGKHIIFALHYFSFFLVFCVLLIVLDNLGNIALQIAIVVTNFVYLFFAIKAFYDDNILVSFIKALCTLILFITLILVYRQLISDITFKLLS